MAEPENDRRPKSSGGGQAGPSHLKDARKRGKSRSRHRIPRPLKVLIGIVLIVLLVVAACVIRVETNPTQFITTSELTQVIKESKLTTAEYRYSGIAYKNPSEDGKSFDYAVYYESMVPAYIDLDKVGCEKDEGAKTFTVVLPEITLGDPNVDPGSLAFLPEHPDAEQREIIALCQQDARDEATDTGGVIEMARNNLHSAIEGLVQPLIEPEGYSLEFRDSSPEDAPQETTDVPQDTGEDANE